MSAADLDRCITETSEETGVSAAEVVSWNTAGFPWLRPRLRASYKPGNLRVGGATLRPRKYAAREGYAKIPVISLGPMPWKKLSPFFLGPVGEASNVENYWQFHKVWAEVARQRQIKKPKNKPVRRVWEWPRETHVGAGGEILPAYWKWRAAGFANREAVRRPNARQIPLFSLFQGNRLGLVEAREQIYVPAYRAAAGKTPEFHALLERLRAGDKLMILDLDGPKLDHHPEGVEAEAASLRAWVGRSADEAGRYFPYGHGYVLALLLLEHLGCG